jgi:SAM-dependent methyltransferase
VKDQYGAVARGGLTNESEAVRSIAQAFGYSESDLASLPPQANMGLSCGNPVAVAALRPGEVVVDLGCGGGLDVLLAAQRVGPTGKAIGIDMTPDMLTRAKAGAAQVGASNVEFHLAQIDQLPLPDASVDCIISNCVINLAPDKPKVFREMLRVLKPGGRIAISDIVLKQPLPAEVASDLQAYVGCVAGALLISEYENLLRDAGFSAVVVQDTGADLNAYAQAGSNFCCGAPDGCCSTEVPAESSSLHVGLSQVLSQFDANQYAASARIHAVKGPTDARMGEQGQAAQFPTALAGDKQTCCAPTCCSPVPVELASR